MQILFVHQNFPAQFGHIARALIERHGHQCVFVSRQPAAVVDGIRMVQYTPQGGATQRTHYCARSFENAVAHCHGVYEACRAEADLRPDLIVGHSGFGSTLFLRELYDCPILNYFEYYYRAHNSDMDFRPEFAPQPLDFLRAYCRNGMVLLDLENCDAGYAPTQWQKSVLPPRYADKVAVIFDGVDVAIWRRRGGIARRIGDVPIDPGTRIVTYVSRGLESMRGFDVFMKVAKRIYTQLPNVLFVVVGQDRIFYGGDEKHIAGKSFRDHVLRQEEYDLSKFLFTGWVPPDRLAEILSLGDLHIYLTVPFVLSWSLFGALACGCTVLASNTPPVRELIAHEQTGLLADFHDVDALADLALGVLRDPQAHRGLAEAGMALIAEKYSLEKCLPQLAALYKRGAAQVQAGA